MSIGILCATLLLTFPSRPNLSPCSRSCRRGGDRQRRLGRSRRSERCGFATADNASISVTDTTTDSVSNPLGIDTLNRAWAGNWRPTNATAAKAPPDSGVPLSPNLFEPNRADVWDSQKAVIEQFSRDSVRRHSTAGSAVPLLYWSVRGVEPGRCALRLERRRRGGRLPCSTAPTGRASWITPGAMGANWSDFDLEGDFTIKSGQPAPVPGGRCGQFLQWCRSTPQSPRHASSAHRPGTETTATSARTSTSAACSPPPTRESSTTFVFELKVRPSPAFIDGTQVDSRQGRQAPLLRNHRFPCRRLGGTPTTTTSP